MKRIAVLVVFVSMLALPAVGFAQYGSPMGGSSGGGQSSGGNISVGGGGTGNVQMGGQAAGANEQSHGHEVSIVDFAFQPGATIVHVGDTVTWANSGGVSHTVTSDAGAFDSGILQPGGSYSQTFNTPGVYPYHCEIHPQMTGMVIVNAA
jgi:plastocyanin